jgi:hypothetical protein
VVYLIYTNFFTSHASTIQLQVSSPAIIQLTEVEAVVSANVKSTGTDHVSACTVRFSGDEDASVQFELGALQPGEVKSISKAVGNESNPFPVTVGISYQIEVFAFGGDNKTYSTILSAQCTGSGGVTKKFTVTFNVIGLDSSKTGQVMWIDGEAINDTDMPRSYEWPLGSVHYASYLDEVASTEDGKRFWKQDDGGLESPLIVVADLNAFCIYKAQYRLDVKILPADGGTVTLVPAPPLGGTWYGDGQEVAALAETETFDHWLLDGQPAGTLNPLDVKMDGHHDLTAVFRRKVQATFSVTGVDSNATETLVDVDGTGYGFFELPKTFTWLEGSSHNYTFRQQVSGVNPGKRFILTGVTGPQSPVTVTGDTEVVGQYQTQWQTTFGASGLDGTAHGAAVSINGQTYQVSDMPLPLWVNDGTSITYDFSDVIQSTDPTKEFVLVNVTIWVTGSTSVTGNYVERPRSALAANSFSGAALGLAAFLGTGTAASARKRKLKKRGRQIGMGKNLLGKRALGSLGLILCVVCLLIFVSGIAYVAFYLMTNEGFSPQGGTFAVQSASMFKTGDTVVVAITISNLGPNNLVGLNFTINGESVLKDLASEPVQAKMQRGFDFRLSPNFELEKTYTLTVVGNYPRGETCTAIVSIVCKGK